MKKIIFILFLVLSAGTQAGELRDGFSLGIMGTSGTGDEFVTSPGSFVVSYDHGDDLVVGIDLMPGGPLTARLGKKIGGGVLSIGIGQQASHVNGETVGSIVYDSVNTNLNLGFIEYKRGDYFGRVGSRSGRTTQNGLDGDTPVSRLVSTTGTFFSFGVRVALNR